MKTFGQRKWITVRSVYAYQKVTLILYPLILFQLTALFSYIHCNCCHWSQMIIEYAVLSRECNRDTMYKPFSSICLYGTEICLPFSIYWYRHTLIGKKCTWYISFTLRLISNLIYFRKYMLQTAPCGGVLRIFVSKFGIQSAQTCTKYNETNTWIKTIQWWGIFHISMTLFLTHFVLLIVM